MGKLRQFCVILTTPVAVSGQCIQGYVLVDLNEPMKMRGIRLRFHGSAYVHWTEQHSTGSGKNRRTETRHYSASETYFDHLITMYGKLPGEGGDNPIHPAGSHQYPFQFIVPPLAPSSFEAQTGRVRYTIHGNIDKPWKFDHNCKAAFTVINLLDLNREPMAMAAPQGQNSKTLCCLCCASGPIDATCRLGRMGYVPGDNIMINAEVTNASRRKMTRSFVELVQVVSFHATSKTKRTSVVVARIDHPGIDAGASDAWSGDLLHIPPVPPSRLDGCRIIDIQYIVKFSVDPSGPGFDLVVPMEILIGSIPHQMALQQMHAFPGANMPFPSAPPQPAMPPPADPSAPPAYLSNMPPPSYEECTTGKVDIREDGDNEYTSGDMSYAPKYTYYDWSNHGNR